jgi:hypothetical protein
MHTACQITTDEKTGGASFISYSAAELATRAPITHGQWYRQLVAVVSGYLLLPSSLFAGKQREM